MQADVADEEEAGLEFVVEAAGALHHGEIQAGLRELGDVLDRQIIQRALVLLAVEHEAVGVDRIGDAATGLPLRPYQP